MGRRFSLRLKNKIGRKEEKLTQSSFIRNVILIRKDQAENSVPCFKLNDNCWDSIFDNLSMRRILNISKTCVEMERIVGNYVHDFFPLIQFLTCKVFIFWHSLIIRLKKMNGK